MNSVIDALQSATAFAVDLIVIPLARGSADWQLFWISFVAGVLFLLAYGAVSNQKKLKQVKSKIAAALLEVVLYRHNLRALLAAQRDLLVNGVRYFLLAVPPILILIVPCLLLLANLNMRFGARALNPGESALLSVQLKDRKVLYRTSLAAPEGVLVSPPVRIAESEKIVWRVTAQTPQNSALKIRLGDSGSEFSADLLSGKTHKYVPTASYNAWWERLLYPDTSVAPASALIESISLSYPEASTALFGLKMHWIAIFAIVSILSGILASRVFRVEI